jgi:arabinofuranosyltransferase
MSKKKQKQIEPVPSKSRNAVGVGLHYAVIILAIAIFIYTCLQIDVTQDDAYISFRYAANYLSGHGLVYNYGEHVEGYTNFLWVMMLVIFKGVFGIQYFYSSRAMGMISGAVIFYLLYVLLRTHYKKVPLLIHISLAVALLSNLSMAYWSIAGLETAAFACMAMAAVLCEYRRPQLTAVLLIIASLLRPEGVLIFGIILINRIITERKIPWEYSCIYVVPLVPFAVFKLLYFGSLFPNPFYAKTGAGIEYLESGLEYLWYFTRTVGVYGIVFLVPLIVVRRLWSKYSLLYVYVLLYTAYIVWVGGDVLKVYRFFVPVVPVLYFLFVLSVAELISLMNFRPRYFKGMVLICTAAFSIASPLSTYEYVMKSKDKETDLTSNMHFISTMLKRYMGSNFSLATSTIGMAGYQLLGHRVIDMLGLTDPIIARYPEKVEGLKPTWKERRFNNHYLLEQQPEFIMFSTFIKPSAAAERALMLHSEFRHNYTTVGFLTPSIRFHIWRRKGEINISKDSVHPDIEFVNKFIDGINQLDLSQGKSEIALADFLESQRLLGENYPILSTQIGRCYQALHKVDSAQIYFRQALSVDALAWDARMGLIKIIYILGDTATANRLTTDFMRLSPWALDRNYDWRETYRADEPF